MKRAACMELAASGIGIIVSGGESKTRKRKRHRGISGENKEGGGSMYQRSG